MGYGVTERELTKLAYKKDIDVLKRGGIDNVINILDENYENQEEERLRGLKKQEIKRALLNDEQGQVDSYPSKKPHEEEEFEKKYEVPWDNSMKPGFLPAPRKYGAKSQEEEPIETEAEEKVAEDVPTESDSTACRRLPLWFVHDQADLVTQFLQAETHQPLYDIGNALVIINLE